MGDLTRRKVLMNMRSELELDRSSFISQWKDISDYVKPRRSRFTVTDVNKGDRRNHNIFNNQGTLASRTLRSGMLSGMTSPARPWFRLTTPDPDLAEFGRVKEYLEQCKNILSTSFLKSNLYNTLPIVYGDMADYSTAPFSVEEIFNGNLLHTQSFPVGSYMIAVDEYGRVNTFIRDFQMTIGNIVKKYGKLKNGKADWTNISQYVRDQYERGNYNQWIECSHFIMPNDFYTQDNYESKFKKFASTVIERAVVGTNGRNSPFDADDNMKNRMLSEKGYDQFPILCPRWEVTGEDAYGTDCPGMQALGDIKQLQLGERRSYEAIEKMIRPPMVAPASMRNSATSILPGDVNFIPSGGQGDSFRAAFEVNFPIQHMEAKQRQTEQRISRAYFEDLWLMISNDNRSNITAEEIRARKEERLLAIGPVLEQLNQDALDPLIDLAFEYASRQRLLPPPPPELQGVNLKVDYVSVLAQAQKLITIGSVERFAGFASNLQAVDPSVKDKVDYDQMIDVYGEIVSLPPSIIRTDDQVAQIRQRQAEAMAQKEQAEMAAQNAQTVKNLATAPTDGDSALTALLQQAQAGA